MSVLVGGLQTNSAEHRSGQVSTWTDAEVAEGVSSLWCIRMSMLDDCPPRRELVVIGASAGGVETLKRVVAGLPADLAAAICVVLHISPESPSALAPILDRAGPLPCRAATDGQELQHGHVLVAPPDKHLVVDDRRAKLTDGPRERGHRPAVDTLFCSAAQALGSAVIGVVLSGNRDDGAAGLSAIKATGGAAIVQDPAEALFPGMPASALARVAADAVAPSSMIARIITAMVNGGQPLGAVGRSTAPALDRGPEAPAI
jgi:two-component system chemotaxis response regulator CheB